MKFKSGNINELFTLAGDFSLITGDVNGENGHYIGMSDGIKLDSFITKHESGVSIRRDTLRNVSDREISIRCALSKFTYNSGEYEVYTQYSEWCCESEGRWQRLNTEIAVENDDMRLNCGSAPFVAIYNCQNGRGTAFHLLADSTFEIKVRKCFSQNGWKKTVTVELGIREKGFDLTLKPGEEIKLPEILFYEFENKNDMAAYKLHRYWNALYTARSLPIVYDTWLSKFDTISYELLCEQLEKAKYLGVEYFVIDAGWFGEPNKWFDSVGDWEECVDASMRGRMLEFANRVRDEGLKFGLWFEIERASLASKAYKAHPEHYLAEGNNAFVNFASENTCDYIFDVISEQIKKYGIEYIKFDYNAQLAYDPENLSFVKFYEGYNGFIKRLRREFPSLYLENCASGGLRMALGALANGFDSIWMSDNHSLYEQLRIFKDTMIRMPSRALERWMTLTSAEVKAPGYNGSSPTDKILVSGDCGWGHVEAVNADYLKACTVGGPIGLTCDLCELSDGTLKLIKEHISEYKAEREFWAQSECHILCDTETMLVLQFNDVVFDKIVICSYAKIPHQNAITVYPICDREGEYEADCARYKASELYEEGVELKVKDRYTASMLTIKKVK